jgi:hypothetical protein
MMKQADMLAARLGMPVATLMALGCARFIDDERTRLRHQETLYGDRLLDESGELLYRSSDDDQHA